MAKSKWMVLRSREGGKQVYIAYRMLDTERPDRDGNREYFGRYSEDRSAVAALVDGLNDREAAS